MPQASLHLSLINGAVGPRVLAHAGHAILLERPFVHYAVLPSVPAGAVHEAPVEIAAVALPISKYSCAQTVAVPIVVQIAV
eukprot:5171884-Prorocentrum_lima.AAC.1